MTVVSVGNVLVERELLDARFCCNLDSCRGACCVEGELGAPITYSEAAMLESAREKLRTLLPERHRRYINRHGCTEVYQGNLYTRTIEGRECVFVRQEEGPVAFCAIEVGLAKGLVTEAKPLSCRLFPIRVRKKFGLDYLVYEQHAMCRDARSRGSLYDVRLIDYVGAALRDLYGDEWYESLKAFVDKSS